MRHSFDETGRPSALRRHPFNSLLYYSCGGLLFLHAYIGLSSFGMFGSEGYGRLRALAASNILTGVFCLLNVRFLKHSPMLVRVWIIWVFWVLMSCFVLLIDFGANMALLGILEVMFCPLTFLLFYIGTRQNPAKFRINHAGFIMLLGVVSFLFLRVFQYRNQDLTRSMGGLNAVYYVLLLLPWVLVCRNQVWKYGGTALIVVAVTWSLKRTALVALALALFAYLISLKGRDRKRSYWQVFSGAALSITIMVFVFFFVDDRTTGFLSKRLAGAADTGGSGRVYIYAEVIQLQAASTMDYWLLGHGHNAVREWTQWFKSAHNDWIEVLFDYGIPGLAIYAVMNVLLFRQAFAMCRVGYPLGPPFMASCMLFLTLSMTSHLVLYPTYFAYLAAFWGTALAVAPMNPRAVRRPRSWVSGRKGV